MSLSIFAFGILKGMFEQNPGICSLKLFCWISREGTVIRLHTCRYRARQRPGACAESRIAPSRLPSMLDAASGAQARQPVLLKTKSCKSRGVGESEEVILMQGDACAIHTSVHRFFPV